MIRIEMSGGPELKRYLDTRPEAIKAAVWDEMQYGAYNIDKGAKERCPTRKKAIRINGQLYSGGRLKSSIHPSFYKAQFKVTVGTNVTYGPYVEYGTVKMRAQPFLNPAFEAEKTPLLDRIDKAIEGALGGSR
ncbi:MAG: HK97-gp10 family putative phage morphogenesis protein [Methanomassiliicoccales archaeon]|jgi:HK97 gp10 family phage protein